MGRKAFFLAIIVFPILCILALLVYSMWTPFLDDGPFYGQPVAVPQRRPDQVFNIGKLTLWVFDPPSKAVSPIVACKSKDKLLWCVQASGWPNTPVYRIRFKHSIDPPIGRTRITGIVDWTFGNEAMWWFLNDNGSLNSYYYSW
jgi:hypothetical protein